MLGLWCHLSGLPFIYIFFFVGWQTSKDHIWRPLSRVYQPFFHIGFEGIIWVCEIMQSPHSLPLCCCWKSVMTLKRLVDPTQRSPYVIFGRLPPYKKKKICTQHVNILYILSVIIIRYFLDSSWHYIISYVPLCFARWFHPNDSVWMPESWSKCRTFVRINLFLARVWTRIVGTVKIN